MGGTLKELVDDTSREFFKEEDAQYCNLFEERKMSTEEQLLKKNHSKLGKTKS